MAILAGYQQRLFGLIGKQKSKEIGDLVNCFQTPISLH